MTERLVLFTEYGATTRGDFWSFSLVDRKATLVLRTEFGERSGQLSPDGHWMAYVSDESGRDEVYVQPFPGPGPKSMISRDGGNWPRWRRDGKELFFLRDERDAHGGRREGRRGIRGRRAEAALQGAPEADLGPAGSYDVTQDGQRFLVNVTSGDETVAPITLVLNWTAALKR